MIILSNMEIQSTQSISGPLYLVYSLVQEPKITTEEEASKQASRGFHFWLSCMYF